MKTDGRIQVYMGNTLIYDVHVWVMLALMQFQSQVTFDLNKISEVRLNGVRIPEPECFNSED